MTSWGGWGINQSVSAGYLNRFAMTATSSSANSSIVLPNLANLKIYPNPKTADAPEQYPHYLRIVNHAEDYGQEDYKEDLEWEICHSAECEHELHNELEAMLPIDSSVRIPMRKVYTCPVGYYEHSDGMYTLWDEEGNNIDWKTLEPGEYPIEAWGTHQPSTPNSPEEWDGGLRLK